jgi:hypothetical protein
MAWRLKVWEIKGITTAVRLRSGDVEDHVAEAAAVVFIAHRD